MCIVCDIVWVFEPFDVCLKSIFMGKRRRMEDKPMGVVVETTLVSVCVVVVEDRGVEGVTQRLDAWTGRFRGGTVLGSCRIGL